MSPTSDPVDAPEETAEQQTPRRTPGDADR